MSEPPIVDAVELPELVRAAAAGRDRFLVGLAGPPGVGKSTTAAWLAAALGGVPLVPMDGFHLAQAVLDAAGTADRKGAPHTFDGAGFVALLRRLRTPRPGEVVYAPRFDRDLEEPIAGAIPVPPEAGIVIVEGNYLLLDEGPWAEIHDLLDLRVHLHVDPDVRLAWLVSRHVAHGRSPEAARAWVERSDEANARIVDRHRGRADLLARPAPLPE